jgi:D-alanine-D-alanine ligase
MAIAPHDPQTGKERIWGISGLKIGLTYDLRSDYLAEGYTEEETAEFDRLDTIEAIEAALRVSGYQTDRIGHVKALARRLISGDRWDMVFNIAEGLRGYGRESQVPALLEAYDIPYTFSDPLVLSLALHKGMAKHVLRDSGIPTPDFAVIETEDDTAHIKIPFPLFAKPVAEGTGKGITAASKITSQYELKHVCRNLLIKFSQPVLIESFLPGRELTVGIVGTGKEAAALGVMEIHLKDHAERDVYSFINKENYAELVEYELVDDTTARDAKESALAAWRSLGCRDAGRIDLRADASGCPNVMEINPLAGLHPVHSDLPIICNLSGIPYNELIAMIMRSARKRLME